MTTKTTLDPETQAAIEQYGHRVGFKAAAKIAGCSERTIRRLVEQGELPCYRVGSARVLRVKTVDVLALVERVA